MIIDFQYHCVIFMFKSDIKCHMSHVSLLQINLSYDMLDLVCTNVLI